MFPSRQRIKFWLEDPSVLVRHWELWPTPTMCEAQRLNVFTLLVVVIAVILKFMGSKDWWLFLLGGLLLVIVIWYTTIYSRNDLHGDVGRVIENYRCPTKDSKKKRYGDRVKTYHDDDQPKATPRFCPRRR